VRILVNHSLGTIPTNWGGVLLRRVTPYRDSGAVAFNGNVGIGITAPTYRLQLPNVANATGKGQANAWDTYSSIRWKENIVPINDALEKINQLNPVYFDWKQEHGGNHSIGFIAEQIGQVIPEVVSWESDGVYASGVNYGVLSSLAIKGIQEQQLQLNTQLTSLNSNQAALASLQSSLFLPSVGNVGIGELSATSSSELDLSELEQLEVVTTDATSGAVVTKISNFQEAAIGKLQTGIATASGLIAENALITRAKITDLASEALSSTSATIDELTTQTLASVQATIDELTTRQIKIGNFVLVEQDDKLQILDQDLQPIASFDQDGNTQLAGSLTTTQVETTSPPETPASKPASSSSLLAELIVDQLQTNQLTATGSTQLGELVAASVETDTLTSDIVQTTDLTATGSTQLAQLIANTGQVDDLAVTNSLTTNQLNAAQIEISEELRAQASRFEQLESKLAQIDEIRTTTAQIINGEIETAAVNRIIGQTLQFDQASINTATVSGTLFADNIAGFEEKVAQAFRQSSLLSGLLSSDESQEANQELLAIIESAGYSATNSNQLRRSIVDLGLDEDEVVITPSAAYINQYLEVNGTAYISDSLAVSNYLVMGNGLKMVANQGLASIDYVNTQDPASSTLYLQSSGQGRIDLMAGVMSIDSSGSVIVNGDMWIAGSLGVEGKLATSTLLTNLIETDNYDEPTQIKLASFVDENGEVITGEVAGESTENTQVKQSRLEIIDERGAPVATISATGRAEFADGLGIGQEDLSETADPLLGATSITHKTSGRAQISLGETQIAIRTSKVSENSQIFVTPLGSTANQVLYVKSQVSDDPNTADVEGLFVVGFDTPATQDVLFNWWIVN